MISAEDASKLKLFSFSAGPRICIGKKFAMLEMKVIMSMIIQRFKWDLTPGYEWKDSPFSITLSPQDNVKIVVERR